MKPWHMRARPPLGTEREFFEGLYREHYPRLFAYVARRAGRDLAHDVVAETFLTAWRKLESVPAEPLPWLIGIARNRLANDDRSARRRERLRARLEAHEARGVSVGDSDVAVERGIAEAFDRLSRVDREILALIAWDELSLKEASIVLRVSYVACRLRFHRAKKRFAAQIQEIESRKSPRPVVAQGAKEAQ